MHMQHVWVTRASTRKWWRTCTGLLVLQERLARIDQEVVEEEERQKLESEMKRQQIDDAERRRHDNRDVSEDKLIDDMFRDIIGDQQADGYGKGGPAAFQVSRRTTTALARHVTLIVHDLYFDVHPIDTIEEVC